MGPKLVDKIHIDVGDMDNFYLNLAVMDLERFLATTTDPHLPGVFRYGRPSKGHGWQHTTSADLVRENGRRNRAARPGGCGAVANAVVDADREPN